MGSKRVKRVGVLVAGCGAFGMLAACSGILGIAEFSAADDAGSGADSGDGATSGAKDSAAGSESGGDSGVSSGADSGGDDGGSDAGCTPSARRCSFNGVETCTAGSWGSPVACPASAPACSDGGCTPPPSCQPSVNRTANCGSDGGESCCTSLEVAGGSYDRTYTNSETLAIRRTRPILRRVSGFRLDKYLVTVGRFRQFVDAWNGGRVLPPASVGQARALERRPGARERRRRRRGRYEPGWVASDDSNIAPTNANLTCQSQSAYRRGRTRRVRRRTCRSTA